MSLKHEAKPRLGDSSKQLPKSHYCNPRISLDLSNSWISKLDQSFDDYGLIDAFVARSPEKTEFYSFWQHTYMMVLEEMSYSVNEGDTVRDLLQKTQTQTPEGVFWRRGHLTFVGKKPSV